MTLTVDDLLAGYNNPDWGQFGYLGERQIALDASDDDDPDAAPQPVLVAFADQLVIDVANTKGWTAETLFGWSNSKIGRWFGVSVFGGDQERGVADYLHNADPAEFMG